MPAGFVTIRRMLPIELDNRWCSMCSSTHSAGTHGLCDTQLAAKRAGLAVSMLIDRLTFCDLYAFGMHCSGQLPLMN